jgi:hypothetical protein
MREIVSDASRYVTDLLGYRREPSWYPVRSGSVRTVFTEYRGTPRLNIRIYSDFLPQHWVSRNM